MTGKRESKELQALREALTDPRHDPEAALALIKQAHQSPSFNIPDRSPGRIVRGADELVGKPSYGHFPSRVEFTDQEIWWYHNFTTDGVGIGRPSRESREGRRLRLLEENYLRSLLEVQAHARKLAGIKNPNKVRAGKTKRMSARDIQIIRIFSLSRLPEHKRALEIANSLRPKMTPRGVRKALIRLNLISK